MSLPEVETLPMRERILQAAPAVIHRFTLARFGMEDVAKAVGIARQTIYKHFPNKDALLIAIYVRQMRERQVPAMAEAIAKPPSAKNLLGLFMVELGQAMLFPLFEETLDPKTAPLMAELCLNSPELMSVREEIWLPILDRYVQRGIVRPDLNRRAAIRWITYQQFWFLTHPTVLSDSISEIEIYVRDFVIRSLLKA
ncbi:MAG: ttgR 3 [Hydrocarboniphaga sp.]|uniref:TetR/AcrR family transcriptional regulator n=1 Tax=Hydrocarboniphaga sp. TaxID=2033016 RepID=UPI002636500A|nr:TetR/AcrR family transcriptional regulator [Hydrocarboniphaga sp.]MDB5969183.1 ttgR 3 [Hydrocarboniphaga sp.]